MTFELVTNLLACAGFVVLLELALKSRNWLVVPLSLLCVDLFFWNLAEAIYLATGFVAFHWLDLTVSPFTPALGFGVVCSFVGAARRLRWVQVGAYVTAATLSVAPLAKLLGGPTEAPMGRGWTSAFLWFVIVLIVLSAGILIRYLLGRLPDAERHRTWLLLLALPICGAFGMTAMLPEWVGAPDLSAFGALAMTALLVGAGARTEVLQCRAPQLGAKAFGWLFVPVGYLGVTNWISAGGAIRLTALVLVSWMIATLGLRWRGRHREALARQAEWIRLGRFSGQLAHDVRNPLAAIKGASAYLVEELRRGSGDVAHREFLLLIAEQVDRMDATLSEYRRLGRIEPTHRQFCLAELVEPLLRTLALPTEAIRVRTTVPNSLPICIGDLELLRRSVDNLCQNAMEAMPAGGTLSLDVTPEAEHGAEGRVLVTVSDTGAGIAARDLDRIFDDFYTTKTYGSGLGLSFVRQVVDAHRGEMLVRSRPGEGTSITLTLPIGTAALQGRA